MLLVPVDIKDCLVKQLSVVSKNTNYKTKIGIKNVKKIGRIYDCANSWVQIGVASLRSKEKSLAHPIFMGELDHGRKKYTFYPKKCHGAKFILFCEKDKHNLMKHYPDHASKIETTFRMGFTGGIHYLGNENNPIHIEKIHFDGHEHYHRNLDKNRIINRIISLRSYCSISDRNDLIDDRSSDQNKSNSQDYEDCLLLQLTDLLIGCSRTILGEYTREIHKSLSLPLKAIFDRYREGPARMKNSRWENSLCLSRCYLDVDHWEFESLTYGEKNSLQLSLI
ncbi:MAG: hypothetical protein JEZ00_15615 [Anaerolineaceae bacterium]|nr:hypothetical protein [Anaerolineaceae bacterium]